MVTRVRRRQPVAWLALMAGLVLSIPAAPQNPSYLYATFLGSSGWDEGLAIAAGPDGTAYIAGTTRYPTDFLELTGPAPGPPPVEDRTGLFVLALNASGQLRYLTYITTFEDPWKPEAQDIAVAPDGTVSLSFTLSRSSKSFVYLTRVSPAGWQTGALLLAGFQAGAGGLAVDDAGNAYVGVHNNVFSGSSSSRLFSVFKVAPDQSIVYRVDLDGRGEDEVTDLSIDGTGRVFFTGGGEDAFLAEIHPAGHLDSFTYLGGSGDDLATALAVDADGNIVVTGVTTSPDFPLARPVEPPPSASEPHFFLTRLSASGDPVSSTYVGPDRWNSRPAIAWGPGGDLFWMGFPGNVPPWDPEAYFCEGTAFLRFDPDGLDLLGDFCYYTAIAADLDNDPEGHFYVTGLVREDFSATPGALQPFFAGRIDAFAARLRLNRPPGCATAKAIPSRLWPPNGKLVPVKIQGVTDADGDPVTLKITGIRQDEPLSREGEPDAAGLGAPAATLRADRAGSGDGRVYRLSFEARDSRGAACTGAVKVCVPRDQRPGAGCGEGEPLVDSTALDAGVASLSAGTDASLGPATILDSFYIRWNGSQLAVDDTGRAFTDGLHLDPEPLPWTNPPGAPAGPPYGPVTDWYMKGDTFVVGYAPGGQNFYRAFVAGPAGDQIKGLAADSSGLYVARESSDTEFSWVQVEKLDSTAVGPPLYSSVVAGGHWANVNDIAVDASGNAYVTGRTGNRSYDDYNNPYQEAVYVTKVDGTGTVRFYQELDGMGYDEGNLLDVDDEGNVYAAGVTSSPDFPGVGGGTDTEKRFVAKIGPSGEIVYSTRFDGGKILEIAAAGAGEVYLLSWNGGPYLTRLDGSGAPVSGGPLDIAFGGLAGAAFGPDDSLFLADADMLARVDLATGLSTSTRLPGVYIDKLAVDGAGHVYVSGGVLAEGLFPEDGIGKSFLAKLSFNRAPDCSDARPGLGILRPPNGRLVPLAILDVTDPDGDPVTLKITGIRQDEPVSPRNGFDATGLGTPAAMVRADRLGGGDGRVYHLGFEARDDEGAACTATVKVCVPHDQRPGAGCGDGGPLFDSTGE